MADEEQLAILRKGVKEWNLWREKFPSEMVDLRMADLTGAYLQGANLKRANLEGVTLKGANLWKTSLWGANVREANLRRANLEGADLREANFRGANLEDADLREANLRAANLQDTNLRGADLESANLWLAKLTNAVLERAYLVGANLQGALLQAANLRGAQLDTAELQGANLQGANLEGADLQDASLISVDLESASLIGANLRAAVLRGAAVAKLQIDKAITDEETHFPESFILDKDLEEKISKSDPPSETKYVLSNSSLSLASVNFTCSDASGRVEMAPQELNSPHELTKWERKDRRDRLYSIAEIADEWQEHFADSNSATADIGRRMRKYAREAYKENLEEGREANGHLLNEYAYLVRGALKDVEVYEFLKEYERDGLERFLDYHKVLQVNYFVDDFPRRMENIDNVELRAEAFESTADYLFNLENLLKEVNNISGQGLISDEIMQLLVESRQEIIEMNVKIDLLVESKDKEEKRRDLARKIKLTLLGVGRLILVVALLVLSPGFGKDSVGFVGSLASIIGLGLYFHDKDREPSEESDIPKERTLFGFFNRIRRYIPDYPRNPLDVDDEKGESS